MDVHARTVRLARSPIARAFVISAFVLLAAEKTAHAARAVQCAVSDYTAVRTDRDGQISEARELSFHDRWDDARAVYIWILSSSPDDGEALFGLARLDAWGKCYALSERGYRKALRLYPKDGDIRAGLADLLTWTGRSAEAVKLLETGMQATPDRKEPDPLIVSHRGRLLYWEGDATGGSKMARAASDASPDDEDLRAIADELTTTEARLTLRWDHYPSAYQDILWVTASGMQRFGRFELTGGAQFLYRPMITAQHTAAETDVRYPFGLAYHFGIGKAVGVEIAPGAPAVAIPDIALRVFEQTPIVAKFDQMVAYSFWNFASGETVHTLNPTLGYEVTSTVRADVHAYISLIHLPSTGANAATTEPAAAIGAEVTWAARPLLSFGASYTYGAELDQNPVIYELQTFRSHVGTLYADGIVAQSRTAHARLGLRPLIGIERRAAATPNADAIVIESVELGAYLRW